MKNRIVKNLMTGNRFKVMEYNRKTGEVILKSWGKQYDGVHKHPRKIKPYTFETCLNLMMNYR